MGRGLTFPYKQMDGRYRPIIPIELEHSRPMRYEVLVDSGADNCILPGDIGRALGLTIESGEKFQLDGVTGTLQTGYFHMVAVNSRLPAARH